VYNLDNCIDSIDFSPATVLRALKYCKHVSNAYDPDGFTTFAVKNNDVAYSLVIPLCVLFKFVFSTNSIPVSWKTANVMPIFLKRHLF